MTVCVRPVPATGPSPLWVRSGRDAERAKDIVRCLCGQPGCRDAEVKVDDA